MGCKACQAPLSMGILQATILEWVAFPFSRGSSQLRDQTQAGLPHCRWILYQLSHKGSSQILEWVAYPFSRGSSQPRNRTGVSCIAGRFFTSCYREAPNTCKYNVNVMHSCQYMENACFAFWDIFPIFLTYS